jgi:asparagine N-glycosylation enzyme membrane subunit Stt3
MKYLHLLLAVLLLLCLAPMPYGFYQLVRFVAMVILSVFAYIYWSKESKPLAVTFGALALLFQPFQKIALGREMWNIVDVLVASGLIILFFFERKYDNKLK